MAAAAAILNAVTLGCYTLVPSQTSNIAPGREFGLEINDLGRINLTPLIGGDVARIAGTLVQQTSTEYTLKVQEMTYLNGRTSQWSGEPITVKTEFVRTVLERQFSTGKTAAAVLAGAGVVTGVIVGRSLNGSGDAAGGETKVPPGGTAIRDHQ
jgi:hypothetical protein